MQNKRNKGALGEKRVADYLEKRGYRVLEKNYRCGFGEIDLIAAKDKYLIFIEVKYRSSDRCGEPAEAVDGRKQRRISNAASYYLYRHGYPTDVPCRFDVAAILGSRIRIYEDAFPYRGDYGI